MSATTSVPGPDAPGLDASTSDAGGAGIGGPLADEAYRNLELRPGFLIRRLHQIHLALFAEECGAFGVTPVQYSIMTVVAARPRLEQGRIAYEVGVDRTTMADVTRRLESRGLMERTRDPADKRTRLLTLTQAGLDLLAQMDDPARRAHARTLEPLGAAERAELLRTLGRLVDANNDYGRAPMRLG